MVKYYFFPSVFVQEKAYYSQFASIVGFESAKGFPNKNSYFNLMEELNSKYEISLSISFRKKAS